MAENRDKHAAHAALGVGAAAGLTSLNANRIANNVNNWHTDRYRKKAEWVKNNSHGVIIGNPMDKIDTSKLPPGERVMRNEGKRFNKFTGKRKQGLVNALNAKAKKVPFTPYRRGVLMQTANAIALPSLALGAHYSVDKADVRRRDVDAAMAGAVGGGLGYQVAGYALKPLDRRFERKVRADDEMTRVVREHRQKVGLPANAPAGHEKWRPYFRTYPTSVPGGRLKRALAITHTGRSGTALTAAAALAGAGAVGRLSMKGREVSKGTNIREYPNLPEWIKEDGIPSTRRNPINPLQMYSSGLMMQDAKSGHGKRYRGKARRRVGNQDLMYSGGRAMLYSPLGIGTLR